MLIERAEPWLLTPIDAIALRSRRDKFWRTKLGLGNRAVVCRECGEEIDAGVMRIAFKHFSVMRGCYDKIGFAHAEQKVCQENLLVSSHYASLLKEVEANPEAYTGRPEGCVQDAAKEG